MHMYNYKHIHTYINTYMHVFITIIRKGNVVN